MTKTNTRALVTGGSGFIGQNLTLQLIGSGYQVINLDLAEPDIPHLKDSWVKCDITDAEKIDEIVASFKPELVFNLAARTDLDGTSLFEYRTNFQGLTALLQVLNEQRFSGTFVHFSSLLVNDVNNLQSDLHIYNPKTFYGESKALGELILQSHQSISFRWLIVRPTSIWGPGFKKPYRDFFEKVKSQIFMLPQNKKVYRNYGYVNNIIMDLLYCVNHMEINRQTYYLCDPMALELGCWADLIADNFKVSKPRRVPKLILQLIAKFGDILKIFGINFPIYSFRLNNMLTDIRIPREQILTGKIKRTDIPTAVRKTCQYFDEQ